MSQDVIDQTIEASSQYPYVVDPDAPEPHAGPDHTAEMEMSEVFDPEEPSPVSPEDFSGIIEEPPFSPVAVPFAPEFPVFDPESPPLSPESPPLFPEVVTPASHNNTEDAESGIPAFDSSDASSSESETHRETPNYNNKKIVLQRFTVYNSMHTMYVIGSNSRENLFRIMEIGKAQNGALTILEDTNFFYTRKDVIDLIGELNKSVQGGVHRVGHGHGLLGLIRFTKGYYLSLITKCSQVAILGGHYVYHIDETQLIPVDFLYSKPRKHSDEERLLAIFRNLDLGKTFYFSYTYDITNSLQTICVREKMRAMAHAARDAARDDAPFAHNERFVWNAHLLSPVFASVDDPARVHDWFQPMIHGFVDQANISIFGRKVYITLIARRSHHFAGARFLKRGVNSRGDVANEVETEQIVCDQLHTSFHDPKYGFYNNPRFTSFVQHRGSIPLFWTQDMSKLPKPPIEVNLSDPFYRSAALHFNNLFQRYGAPVLILNLIKTKEKMPRESKLFGEFVKCIGYLNQFLPSTAKLKHTSLDMSRVSKKGGDVITPLEAIAEKSIRTTGFFHNGISLERTSLQKGINRTNCIDCLDRTNAAEFIIGKNALSYQLYTLGFIAAPKLPYDSDVVNILTEMFHDHGDTIALQYGGSHLVNTMDSYRKINQWSSHTRDYINSIKRIYSNSFMDSLRQEAINLFLGNYVYEVGKTKLWELANDFWLHNDSVWMSKNFRTRNSYIHWYNERYLEEAGTVFALCNSGKHCIKTRSDTDADSARLSVPMLEPYPGYINTWWNETYVPRNFTSMEDVYQFNMNSTARYFPTQMTESFEFDFSPFETRKPELQNESVSGSNGSTSGYRTTKELRSRNNPHPMNDPSGDRLYDRPQKRGVSGQLYVISEGATPVPSVKSPVTVSPVRGHQRGSSLYSILATATKNTLGTKKVSNPSISEKEDPAATVPSRPQSVIPEKEPRPASHPQISSSQAKITHFLRGRMERYFSSGANEQAQTPSSEKTLDVQANPNTLADQLSLGEYERRYTDLSSLSVAAKDAAVYRDFLNLGQKSIPIYTDDTIPSSVESSVFDNCFAVPTVSEADKEIYDYYRRISDMDTTPFRGLVDIHSGDTFTEEEDVMRFHRKDGYF